MRKKGDGELVVDRSRNRLVIAVHPQGPSYDLMINPERWEGGRVGALTRDQLIDVARELLIAAKVREFMIDRGEQ